MNLKGVWQRLLGLCFPRLCPLCGQSLLDAETALCIPCQWNLPLTGSWTGDRNEISEQLWGRFPFRSAAALLYFERESASRRLIHQLKYAARRDLARSLGELLGRELAASPCFEGVELLLPVPLHWSRRIGRGYNQAEEICRGMARVMNLPVETGALRRIRRTPTQTRRGGRLRRWENVQGAFRLRRPGRVEGRRMLLVDDVLTTGATLEAVAAAILVRLPEAQLDVATLAMVRPPTASK